MACPGSIVVHVDRANDAADEGTAAHALAAFALEAGIDARDALARIEARMAQALAHDADPDLEPDPFGEEWGPHIGWLSAEMADHVQVYLAYVRRKVLEHGDDAELHVERRVFFHTEIGCADEQSGTGDAIILSGRRATVIDLKYGSNPNGIVYADENPQLMGYALGTESDFGHLADFEDFELCIVQPRLDHIDEWICTRERLNEFRAALTKTAVAVAQAAARPDPDALYAQGYLVATDKGCRWCSYKAVCPAYAEVVADVTGADFDDLSLVEPLRTITEDTTTLAHYMAHVERIEVWCRAVRAEVETQLLAGVPIAGWKLVKGRKGARAWLKEKVDEVEALLKSKFRLKLDEMYKLQLISPTQAEKVLADSPRRWKQVRPYIVQAEGNLSVAPEADKRPAVTQDELQASVDDFNDLETVPGEAAVDDLV